MCHAGGRESGIGNRESGSGERGAGSGERGAGSGERGAGSGERGAGSARKHVSAPFPPRQWGRGLGWGGARGASGRGEGARAASEPHRAARERCFSPPLPHASGGEGWGEGARAASEPRRAAQERCFGPLSPTPVGERAGVRGHEPRRNRVALRGSGALAPLSPTPVGERVGVRGHEARRDSPDASAGPSRCRKPGIQVSPEIRHVAWRSRPAVAVARCAQRPWIPACAGMTTWGIAGCRGRRSRVSGNPWTSAASAVARRAMAGQVPPYGLARG